MSDIFSSLNPAQLQASTAVDGAYLVVAGAGSGKTRVIEYRVLNLIRHKVAPGAILLLTFTRRASHEMLSRASRLDPQCRSVEGGTFHSFSYKTLKRYARQLGLASSFMVIDEGDAEEAVHRCAAKLGLYEREKRFPKKDTLRSIFSMSINKGAPLAEVLKKGYPHFVEYAGDMEALRLEFTRYKIDRNYLDYDDLLVYLRMLLDNAEVRSRLARQYRYIMVDEYQDVNALQGEIAFLMAQEHGNIMVVGDDAQSIYGFRGSSHETIMEFPRRFRECTVIKLEQNYRSSQPILDVANAVLENMKNKYSKCLIAARQETGERPSLLFFRDAHEEAAWVADRIKGQLDEGVPLHHQCVLFRSLYLSIPLQSELSRRNIPYETYGGLKFYETAHVKDILAHLKVLDNPKDELAWNRALMLIAGVGPRTASAVTEHFSRFPSLAEIVEKGFSAFVRKKGGGEGLGRFRKFLQAAAEEGLSAGDQYETALQYYRPLLKDRYDDWHLRLNDLEALRQIAGRYGSLAELLADFAIEPPERGVWRIEPETKEEEKPLALSTIHSAKGLEWTTVYLMGMMDGVLPVTFSLDSEEDIEEEQRLFYVAVTRAKHTLYLTLHHEGMRGGLYQFNKVSRFLDAPNVLARLEVRHEDAAARGEGAPEGFAGDKEALFERLRQFYR